MNGCPQFYWAGCSVKFPVSEKFQHREISLHPLAQLNAHHDFVNIHRSYVLHEFVNEMQKNQYLRLNPLFPVLKSRYYYIFMCLAPMLIITACGKNKTLYNGEVSLFFNTNGPEVVHYEEIIRERLNHLGIHHYELRILGTHEITVDVEQIEDTSLVTEMLTYNEEFSIWATYSVNEVQSNLDSLNSFLSSEDSTKSKDLWSLLNLTESPDDGSIGWAKVKSTAELNDILEMGSENGFFPNDLKFTWGWFGDRADRIDLFALRKKSEEEGPFLTSENVKSTKQGKVQHEIETFYIEFNDEGKNALAILSEQSINKNIAISFNDSIITCPLVKDKISTGSIELDTRSNELNRHMKTGLLMPLYPTKPVRVIHKFEIRK